MVFKEKLQDWLLYENCIYKWGSRYSCYQNTLHLGRNWQNEVFIFNLNRSFPIQLFPYGFKWAHDLWVIWKWRVILPLFRII